MGNRLSKIYTRTGDDGTTGLGDGSRIDKYSLRMDAIGDIDELNCNLGLLLSETLRADLHELLIDIQHDLFDLGGELSIPDSAFISAEAIDKLERAIDRYNEELPPLKEFILPGGSRAGAVRAPVSRGLPPRGAAYRRTRCGRVGQRDQRQIRQSPFRPAVRGSAHRGARFRRRGSDVAARPLTGW